MLLRARAAKPKAEICFRFCAKLHGIHVTGCVLDYHGSITLDPEQCAWRASLPTGICQYLEQNKADAFPLCDLARPVPLFILNGAAARTCQQGDELIISAVEYVNGPKDIYARKPVVLTFDAGNAVLERLRYVVGGEESGEFTFNVVEEPM